jgi:heptosyltransferase-3
MTWKAAVFSHNGLGDGVNCLVLSHNLYVNGWKVDTYQNTIGSMQNWFPHLPVFSYPSLQELPRILATYDWFFVVQNDTDPFVQALILEGKKQFPGRIKVLYLYPSPNIVNEPYYADCLTNPNVSIAQNMRIVCEKVIHLPFSILSNGFTPPEGLSLRKHSKRVIIHPTSAKVSKNWDKEKFVKLALRLKKEGYTPIFIPGMKKEIDEWQDVASLGFDIEGFASLDLLASYIYESGFLIGNDSGLGHIASAVGVPTLTLCRRKALANLWAPGFRTGVVMTPSSLVPNIRGLRLRDKYWQKFVSVGKVWRGFKRLVALST